MSGGQGKAGKDSEGILVPTAIFTGAKRSEGCLVEWHMALSFTQASHSVRKTAELEES